MGIYTLNNVESRILNSKLLLAKKSQEQKFLLIDKHNFVLHLIISKNLVTDNPTHYYTNIKSTTLKRTIGDRYYNEILNNLIELGLITKNDSYSSDNFSKSYCIPKDVGKQHYPIRGKVYSERFKRKLKEYNTKEFEEINKDPLFHKILVNTSRLQLLPEFSHYIPVPDTINHWENDYGELITTYEDNSAQMLRYDEFANALQRFNETDSLKDIYSDIIFYKPKRVSVGRVYHMVASIPRRIRECLRTKDNELLYEIDMASAQPSILILEYLKHLKDTEDVICSEEKNEAQKCLKILLQGGIYRHIQENSNSLQKLKYSELKKNILTTINAKKNSSVYSRELSNVFPYFMKWINNIKKNQGHQQVSIIGQTAEANIFVNVYNELDINVFALIIHDSILTTQGNTEKIKKELIKRVLFLYKGVLAKNVDLSNLFKVDIVSLKDKELPSVQSNLFSKEMIEKYPTTL